MPMASVLSSQAENTSACKASAVAAIAAAFANAFLADMFSACDAQKPLARLALMQVQNPLQARPTVCDCMVRHNGGEACYITYHSHCTFPSQMYAVVPQRCIDGQGSYCPALPCPALSCPALPCPALPCPALPCPASTPKTAINCVVNLRSLDPPAWCMLTTIIKPQMHAAMCTYADNCT